MSALAPTTVPGNFDAETIAIDAWVDTHCQHLTPTEREAVSRLAFVPFYAASIPEACAVVAAILLIGEAQRSARVQS